jgi:hypothetical protein
MDVSHLTNKQAQKRGHRTQNKLDQKTNSYSCTQDQGHSTARHVVLTTFNIPNDLHQLPAIDGASCQASTNILSFC